jgi:hypothetical protein
MILTRNNNIFSIFLIPKSFPKSYILTQFGIWGPYKLEGSGGLIICRLCIWVKTALFGTDWTWILSSTYKCLTCFNPFQVTNLGGHFNQDFYGGNAALNIGGGQAAQYNPFLNQQFGRLQQPVYGNFSFFIKVSKDLLICVFHR